PSGRSSISTRFTERALPVTERITSEPLVLNHAGGVENPSLSAQRLHPAGTSPNTLHREQPGPAASLGDKGLCDSKEYATTMGPLQESRQGEDNPADMVPTSMCLQPETYPITEKQLADEVRGIYAGLVMVEKKCIEIDRQQSESKEELTNAQWQALIALHRTLLHEHHDFFLASNHPAASTV
ncbi:hypothetical protein T310_5603, partial [Rasamsonia emersonii CBS 393.64]